MLWLLLLLPFKLWAQDESELSAIRSLESKDEIHTSQHVEPNVLWEKDNRGHLPPIRKVPWEAIRESGLETIYLKENKSIIRLEDGEKISLVRGMYVKAFRQADEYGFKYLLTKDKKVLFKVNLDAVTPIKQELVLYEPPHRYTPAPPIMFKEYDQKLALKPEVSFYAGVVKGDFMRDLFNSSSRGTSQQYGAHLFTKWKLPVMVGAAFHYEAAQYRLDRGGNVAYSSFSLGPQVKSPDFHIGEWPWRAQAQFRFSPFARAHTENVAQEQEFKFNSTDILASLEHPIQNGWGNFVIGAFVQYQWLALKDQTSSADVSTSSSTNKSFGLSLSQVFE